VANQNVELLAHHSERSSLHTFKRAPGHPKAKSWLAQIVENKLKALSLFGNSHFRVWIYLYFQKFSFLVFVNVVFENTKIFEYIRIFSFDTNIFVYSFVLIFCYEYIRIFVRIKILIRIYSDIRSYLNFDTNIFGYSFVSIFLRMSHSDPLCPQCRQYHQFARYCCYPWKLKLPSLPGWNSYHLGN